MDLYSDWNPQDLEATFGSQTWVDSEGNEIPQDETVEETTEETTEEIVTEGDHEVADLWLDRNYELEVSEALVEVGSSAYQAVQDWIFYREVSTDWLYGG